MKLILCLDDRNGISFNHRRQSSDREVIKHIIKDNEDGILVIEPYSEKLFQEVSHNNIHIKTPDKAEFTEEISYFTERKVDEELLEKADFLELYFWNRKYPGDAFFAFDKEQWELIEEEDFPGFSHEKITKKTYKKGDKR